MKLIDFKCHFNLEWIRIFVSGNNENDKIRRIYQPKHNKENQRASNTFGPSSISRINNEINCDNSYLDKDAQIPFGKLRKVGNDSTHIHISIVLRFIF